jgi:hypothetical protein
VGGDAELSAKLMPEGYKARLEQVILLFRHTRLLDEYIIQSTSFRGAAQRRTRNL